MGFGDPLDSLKIENIHGISADSSFFLFFFNFLLPYFTVVFAL